MKKAILVCVSQNLEFANKSLDELKSLIYDLGIEEIDRVIQVAKVADHKTYLKKGKLDMLKEMEIVENADYIVFDDELTPAQMFNLDEELKASIIDRAYVILDIFRRRATTLEAQLEIKLANLTYLYPRIRTFHEGFDRQSGKIGSKGSGETQLELDQRMISNQILDTKRKLDEVMKRKKTEISKRKNFSLKTIALVGYTNAGKSSTMNALLSYLNKYEFKNNTLNKNVEAEDKLFKTLTTSVRKLTYNNIPFLLSDTIGFINKIPNELISSFMTTLEEAKNADLIIIVLDVSENLLAQAITTMSTLERVCKDSKPEFLFLLNKIDKMKNFDDLGISFNYPSLQYSNTDEKYQYELLEKIKEFLLKDYEIIDLNIPYSDQKIINKIETSTSVISKTYLNDYVMYKVYCPKSYTKEFSLYRANDMVM